MSYDTEHDGLHALFYLDGLAAGASKALELLEGMILEQQDILQESVDEREGNASDYTLGDMKVLKDAVDDVRIAAWRVRQARETLGKRTG